MTQGMTIKELAKHGYSFRSQSSKAGSCVTLSGVDGGLIEVFFQATIASAMNAARKRAIVDFVSRRLA